MPESGARFLIEIDSIVVGVFKEAEGLEVRREVIEVDEGGREEFLKRAGPFVRGAFRLKEGFGDGPELYRWYRKGIEADHLASSRRTGAIILIDDRGNQILRWKFRLGQITGWEGPQDLRHGAEPYELESIEITHEGLEPVVR